MRSTVKKVKRGRPVTTGKSPIVGVRVPKAELARLDQWAHARGSTRSEAIRDMIAKMIPAE